MIDLVEEIVNRFFDFNVGLGQFLSISRTYGKAPSFNKTSLESRINQISKDLNHIRELKEEINEKDEDNKIRWFELNLVKSRLEWEHFYLTDYKIFKKSIIPYFDPIQSINYVYTVRAYAPIDVRVQHIIDTEKEIPRCINEALQNIDEILPQSTLMVELMALKMSLPYFRDELIQFVSKSNDDILVQEWSDVNTLAIESMEGFISTLESKYLPQASKEFAIGRDKFLKLLKYQELVDIDLTELRDVAENNLDFNVKRINQILDAHGDNFLEDLYNDYPVEENFLEMATKSTTRAKSYTIKNDLVTIPPGRDPIVLETPRSNRAFVFAQMNTADISEDTGAEDAYYYVTPPDANWSPERRAAYLKGWYAGKLDPISIHEVWPGHHLHMLYIKHQKSKIIRQMGFAITTLEGWAHYTEELVHEIEYDEYDSTKIKFGQLEAALMRNCRFLSAIEMHTGSMTMDESQKLFETKGRMKPDSAVKEARRGTIDPMYLNYALGKLMIMKLREDYKQECQEKGIEFSLKRFHDEFLSYGASPIPLIREAMLENPNTSLL